jgi:multiple sugar transport system permease protein
MTTGVAAAAPLAGSPVLGRVVLAAVLGLAVLWIAPLVWVLGLSLKPDDVLIQDTGNILSPPFTLRNYEAILANSLVFRWIANSALVALGQTALILVLSSLAGYGFARAEFPGKNVLFIFVLAGLAVPEQAIFIPLHRIFSDLGLHNTPCGLDPAASRRALRRLHHDAVLQGHPEGDRGGRPARQRLAA